MPASTIAPSLFRGIALTVLLATAAPDASANVIYEFRAAGSSDVIGTIEIAPPASSAGGWSATEPDIVGLFLDDTVFGLGSGNLLLAAAEWHGAISSLSGRRLDIGELSIDSLLMPPTFPGGPPIELAFFTTLHAAAGDDLVARGIIDRDGDDVNLDIDLLTFGDWTAADVPEPDTIVLLGLGLAAAVRAARRRVP